MSLVYKGPDPLSLFPNRMSANQWFTFNCRRCMYSTPACHTKACMMEIALLKFPDTPIDRYILDSIGVIFELGTKQGSYASVQLVTRCSNLVITSGLDLTPQELANFVFADGDYVTKEPEV